MSGLSPGGLLSRWFEEVWNRGRSAAVDEMFAADGLAHGLTLTGEPIRGPEALKAFHRAYREAFPDIRFAVRETVEEGDRACARFEARGTHRGPFLGAAA